MKFLLVHICTMILRKIINFKNYMHLPVNQSQLNFKLAFMFNSNSQFKFQLKPIEKFQFEFTLYRKMNQRHFFYTI
jgi:hypothetical protein